MGVCSSTGTALDKTLPRFEIHVKVGEHQGSGTDANVYIRLHDDKNGLQSRDIKLDHKFKDGLERGQTNVFYSKNDDAAEEFSEVTRLELWRDNFGIDSRWFCEVIIVKDKVYQKSYPFPVLRWVKANYHYNMSVYDTCLPQNSIDTQRRQTEMGEVRKLYELDEKVPGGPLQVKKVPDDEHLTDSYKTLLLALGTSLGFKSIFKSIAHYGAWDSYDDFVELYKGSKREGYPVPLGLERWQKFDKDELFGAQRLIGTNPVMIQLATTIPEKFAVTDELVKPFLEGLDLEKALNDKKLFLVDYNLLDALENKNGEAEICAPFGLFYLKKNNKLVPIAIQLHQKPAPDNPPGSFSKTSCRNVSHSVIQLHQKPAPDNPVFVPSDPEHTWTMVKMWFNLADASVHQSITHLAATHLAMEGFAVVTNRQLNVSHPIHKLLSPHFLFIMDINSNALSVLVNEGGFFDEEMNIGHKRAFEIIQKSWANWRLNVQANPEEDCNERGVADPAVIPIYPYRDDSIKVYNAIRNYVSGIIKFYYDSPEKIAEDDELQAWGAELSGPREGLKGLGVKGIPEDGKFTNVDDIITTCACIINACSAVHASVNFTQYDEYAFPPNYSAYIKGAPPTTKEPLKEKDLLDALPERSIVLKTMLLARILSTIGTYNLGSWELRHQYQPEALQAEDRFRERLRKISEEIKARNKSLDPLYKYSTLDPLSIPNAISI